MEKLAKRTREIRFYSEKNKAMCSVHSVDHGTTLTHSKSPNPLT